MAKSKWVVTMPSRFRATINLLEKACKRSAKHCLIEPIATSAGVSETREMIELSIEQLILFKEILDGVETEDTE